LVSDVGCQLLRSLPSCTCTTKRGTEVTPLQHATLLGVHSPPPPPILVQYARAVHALLYVTVMTHSSLRIATLRRFIHTFRPFIDLSRHH